MIQPWRYTVNSTVSSYNKDNTHEVIEAIMGPFMSVRSKGKKKTIHFRINKRSSIDGAVSNHNLFWNRVASLIVVGILQV